MWLDHPRYTCVRDRLVQRLSEGSIRFRRLDHVVFLCGGAQSPTRNRLRQFLEQLSDLVVFYAEDVWSKIADQTNLTALEMEEMFASLSDIVPILVESPGAIAELGAFSLSPELRKKLLPIVDKRFRNDASFINAGPIAWINHESHFSPAIYTDLDFILSAAPELRDRFSRLQKPRGQKIESIAKSPKNLLFYLCDLASVVGPCSSNIVNYYAERTIGDAGRYNVTALLELGTVMKLVSSLSFEDRVFYFQSPNWKPFHFRRFLDLPLERAAQLSALQLIPEARNILERIGDIPNAS